MPQVPGAHEIVLYVEDQETDAFLMGLAFGRQGIATALRTVNDGTDAMNYLSGAGPYHDRDKYPLPCLVLLDLRLPGVNGIEVLRWIRQQTRFKDLPVVVFSCSPLNREREMALKLGANAYWEKQPANGLFPRIATRIKYHWLQREDAPDPDDFPGQTKPLPPTASPAV